MASSPIEALLDYDGPRKILAIDGGGIRGLIALGVIAEIERVVRAATGRPDLRLGDYFDLIAGTSTGAVIAAGLSLGLPVAEIEALYRNHAATIFAKSGPVQRLWRDTYRAEGLAEELQRVFGRDLTLGSDRLRSLLLIVLRNATTDSPWLVNNNPRGKYNDRALADCNLDLPLWRLVRASAAAPTFFPPEEITLGEQSMVFCDGGTTPFNNPSFQAFLMATVDRYQCRWKTGPDRMLLVSVGTGSAPHGVDNRHARAMSKVGVARTLPQVQISGATVEQDILCRVFGKCLAGEAIDEEIGDLKNSAGPCDPKLFTYLRYNVTLTRQAFAGYGLARIDPDRLALDAWERLDDLREIGRYLAGQVASEHFEKFGRLR